MDFPFPSHWSSEIQKFNLNESVLPPQLGPKFVTLRFLKKENCTGLLNEPVELKFQTFFFMDFVHGYSAKKMDSIFSC